MIDLHVHSTYSDGSFTPAQLVELANTVGLTAMALTDHDCTTGIEPFLAACGAAEAAPGGRRFLAIPGVEISADVDKGTMHVLGYFVDHRDEELEEVLVQIRDGRRIRNEKILERLNALGLALSWDEVAAFAGEDVVGRPHFAQAMMARGYVKTKTQAFNRYLAKGEAAYVDRFRLSPADSIRAIRGAGGVAVLSHPFTLDLDPEALGRAVAEWKAMGLAGIEVYYSEHSPEQVAAYLELARSLDLLVTGGSDFHGEVNEGVKLGTGFGTLRVPDALAGPLLEAHRRQAAVSVT